MISKNVNYKYSEVAPSLKSQGVEFSLKKKKCIDFKKVNKGNPLMHLLLKSVAVSVSRDSAFCLFFLVLLCWGPFLASTFWHWACSPPANNSAQGVSAAGCYWAVFWQPLSGFWCHWAAGGGANKFDSFCLLTSTQWIVYLYFVFHRKLKFTGQAPVKHCFVFMDSQRVLSY